MPLRGSLITTALALAALAWADNRGIRPRPTPNDYPARETVNGITIAAAVLTPEQVKKRFATHLNKAYIAVEVAVYPSDGHDIEMSVRDFLARFGSEGEIERPISTQIISARLGKKEPVPTAPDRVRKVHVYTGETIGHETGPYGRGGVYTGTSAGVEIGDPGYPPPPQPPPAGMTQEDVRQELESLALPEGRLSEEVAGYLYFAKPTRTKASYVLHLTYYGVQGKVELTLPMGR